MDVSDDGGSIWHWGNVHRHVVQLVMSNTTPGSYCLFNEEEEHVTLAYKSDSHDVEYLNISHTNGALTVTSPSLFTSVESALHHMMFRRLATTTVVTPLPKPKVPVTKTPIVHLLRRLYEQHNLLLDREEHLWHIDMGLAKLDQELDDYQQQEKAYNVLEKMLLVHRDRAYRTSINFSEDSATSKCFAVNIKCLHERLADVNESLCNVERKIKGVESERNQLSHEFDQILDSVLNIEREMADLKNEVLLVGWSREKVDKYQTFMHYLLVTKSRRQCEPTIIQHITPHDARQLLQSEAAGNYIILRDTDAEWNISLHLIVRSEDHDETDEPIVDLPVTESERYYGLEPDLCIFPTIQDLVVFYTKCPLPSTNENNPCQCFRLKSQIVAPPPTT